MNSIFILIKKRKNNLLNKLFAKKRRDKLKKLDFTIISNNCWAGYVYRFFGMEYLTPTIGLYFFSNDYIKFVSNLKYYLSLKLDFLHPEESKYYSILQKKHQLNVPIGKLDDIEIIFLHYKTKEEAKEKWERRVKRVNYSNLIIKYSLMNDWTLKDIDDFENLKYENKFFFCHQSKFLKYKDAVYYQGFENENAILNDTDFFDKYIDIYALLNNKDKKNNKVLILREPKNSYFLQYLDFKDLYSFYEPKKKKTIFFKLIYKFNIPLFFLFFDKWKKNLNKYKYVIIFDNGYNKNITKYIKKKNKNIKIYFYFWNPITENKKSVFLDKNIDEIYSYSFEDCKKYNLQSNTQFYSKDVPLKKSNSENGILFVGTDKGRKEKINELRIKLEKMNINCNFMIINSEKNFVSYSKYLDLISSSKAILDMINENVTGLTLRVMEAIFFGKKLISNNKDLINYDFYDSSRIFILDYDKLDKLDKFLKTDYKKMSDEILSKYDFEEWIKRFFKR